jgi:membrane protease YdiL (CAAX protease family)
MAVDCHESQSPSFANKRDVPFIHREAKMTEGSALESAGNARHWGLLGTVLWGIGIAITFIVLQSIVMVAYLSRDDATLSDEQLRALLEANNGVAISLATLLTAVLCIPLIFGIAKLKRGSLLREYLAIKAVSLKPLGQWLGVTVVFLLVSDLLTSALGKPIVPEFVKAAYASAEPVWLLWLALAIGAPLFEEVFFRGFLFKGFERALKPTGAIILTAAIWAGIHLQYDLYNMTIIFVLGLLLGVARSRTGSIVAPIAMHALANVVACTEAALLAQRAVS